MKQIISHFVLSAILYCIFAGIAGQVFVVPPSVIEVTSFLPPILGLVWGPVSAFGVAVGEFLFSGGESGLREIAAVFIAAYLPYRLWHLVMVNKEKPLFAFNRTTLKKLILILFVTTAANALILGMTRSEEEIAQILSDDYIQIDSAIEFTALLFLNDFDLAVFFGMPIFFILVSYRYEFYRPSKESIALSNNTYEMNRLAVVLLYGFFLALFVILDVSGVIYDLDHMDTWLQFSVEILTTMNLTMIAFFYLLMKYRHSIMTNLMLMELGTIFIAAIMLGSISFLGLSRAIDDHASNDLEKMSVVYRERLARTFSDTIMAVSSMGKLADNELDSVERLKADESYRKAYLQRLERDFAAIAGYSPGSINFYMQLSKDIANAGFLCSRHIDNWGSKLPGFTHQYGADMNRYHLSDKKYLAKLSEPYYNEKTKRYQVSYVVPLHRGDDFIGIVGIDIDFDYIIHEIKRMSVYEHGVVRLLDKNGGVLYTNRPEVETAFNKEGFYETETYLSTGVWLNIAAFAHDIYADRNNMLIHLVVMTLAIVIAVSLFSIWLAQKGIRPLMQITEATRKIAAGELNVQLPTDSKNELGILVNGIREMVSKLEVYVYRDKLTGLRNAAAYIRKTAELDEMRKIVKDKPLSYGVVVFDANYLKKVNDTYGHEAGNELIRHAAQCICKVFSHSPVFRIGGDEFTAILENHDYEHREELLEAFDRQIAEEFFEADGVKLQVSVARGLGIYQAGMEYADVFKQADEAMYKHKTALKAHRE